MKKEIEFKLSEKITYGSKGEMEETDIIMMTAPTPKNRKYVHKIKQRLMRSMLSVGEKSDVQESQAPDDSEITGDVILAALLVSDEDLSEFYELFVKFACSGVCKLDGDANLTPSLIDTMEMDDPDKLMGEYLANFIMPSLMM